MVPQRSNPVRPEPGPQAPSRRATLVAVLALMACAEQTVDLRTPQQPELVCGANERFNPETGRCSICERVPEPPEETCLCGSEPLPTEFPWCEGESPFRCLACDALESCRTFDPVTEAVGDCGRVRACCAAIEQNPSGTPCCGADEIAVCFEHPTLVDALVLECVAPTRCCDGTTLCMDANDCLDFQECVDGGCTPGCEPGGEFCCEECGCTCEQLDGPA